MIKLLRGTFVKVFVVLFIIIIGKIDFIHAQINNYWSMGSNTSSSLLGGAVVGGGAGDVAIFYNPAAIVVEDQKQISFNASLLSFDLHKYHNALGYKRDLDYLEWGVKPRFISYQFKIKDNQRLSYQITAFSRDEQLSELWDYQTAMVKSEVNKDDMAYTASYDMDRRYVDYWFGVGASYVLSERFSVGATLFGSAKSLRYYQSSVIDIDPLSSTFNKNSSWSSIEKQYFYVISLIPKIGMLYREGYFSFGLNVTLPSMRLWGDGYSKRILRSTNVVVDGQPKPDYLNSQYNNYMVANIKEPLAVAFGLTYHSPNDKSKYFFSAEYFAPIATYRMLDNTKISIWGQDEFEPGDDFLSYKYGTRSVFNVALGYRHELNENFSVLSGIKTNFSAYDPSEEGEWANVNEFVIMSPSLYHFSIGAQFKYKSNTIILGTEYSFGRRTNETQLANYGYPGVYDENQHIALQNYPENTMNYTSQALGFYIGYAFDF